MHTRILYNLILGLAFGLFSVPIMFVQHVAAESNHQLDTELIGVSKLTTEDKFKSGVTVSIKLKDDPIFNLNTDLHWIITLDASQGTTGTQVPIQKTSGHEGIIIVGSNDLGDFRFASEALSNEEFKIKLTCAKGLKWCSDNGTFKAGNHTFNLQYINVKKNELFKKYGYFNIEVTGPDDGSGNQTGENVHAKARSFSPCDEDDDQHPHDYFDFNKPYREANEKDNDKFRPDDCVYFEVTKYVPDQLINVKIYKEPWNGNNKSNKNQIMSGCQDGKKTGKEGEIITDGARLEDGGKYIGVISSAISNCQPGGILVVLPNIYMHYKDGHGDERDGGITKGPQQGFKVQPPCDIEGDKECVTALGKISATPQGFLKAVLSLGIGFAGLIAFLLLLWGGFQIIMSQGNAEKVQNGQAIITSAIIGLVFILASVFLLGFIGGNIIGIPQFKLGSSAGSNPGGGGLRTQDPKDQAAYERAFANCRNVSYNEEVRKACEAAAKQQFGAK